ncbi:hypothetical protein CFD26_106682 [Aspergillus turcosus]|uniref:Uncharacterized protein n=1 Tax=Aspergillus turcosus TaxID=1245748 RepID=A0A421DB59_9EURO|nr:hypothetical protein CFD26_106682 [Aspergillus turcosus]
MGACPCLHGICSKSTVRSRILHATGMAEKIDKILDDTDGIDLAELPSVTEIAMVPSIRQNKHLKLKAEDQ